MKKVFIYPMMAGLLVLAPACKDEKNADSLPALTTNVASDITAFTATLGGNISDPGTPGYYERGVCYSTSQNPTTGDHKTREEGTGGTGNFSRDVTGLFGNTTYYARAYATNKAGTAYGNQVSFTTMESPDITGITLNSNELSLFVGDEFLLTATVEPEVANQNVVWSSSNSAVARVFYDGTVIAVGPGRTTITASTDNGVTDDCEVKVSIRMSLLLGNQSNIVVHNDDGYIETLGRSWLFLYVAYDNYVDLEPLANNYLCFEYQVASTFQTTLQYTKASDWSTIVPYFNIQGNFELVNRIDPDDENLWKTFKVDITEAMTVTEFLSVETYISIDTHAVTGEKMLIRNISIIMEVE